MNLRFLVIALAAATGLIAGEPDGAKHSVAQESLALLKKTFPYQPAADQKPEAKNESDGEVVKMAPFVVIDSRRQREVSQKMESDAQKKKDEQFSVTKGGLIYKNDRFDIGASRNQDLFREDAKYKDKTPMLRIDLVHFRF